MGKLVKNWSLILICLFAFLLRTWNIENLFYFTYDESIPAFVSRRMILWNHIPLIGAATPFGFHLGPYFYWLYAALLFIGRLNPIAWGYTAAIIASITTFLMFLVGLQLSGKKLAITAAILWSFSYLANVYDRHLWALYWGPITTLLVIFLLNKFIKGNKILIYPLSLVIAISIHADPSNLIFVALMVITLLIYKMPLAKNLFIIFVFLFLSLIPLFIFDSRHNFANSRPILEFLKQGKNTPGFNTHNFIENSLLFPRSASRLIYKFGDNEVAKQYSYCKNFVVEKFVAIPIWFVALVSLLLTFFIFWSFKLNKRPWRLVAILLVLYFFGIHLYGTILKGDIFEHYITGSFPIFLLILALLLSYLPKKIWLLSIFIFVTLNLYKLSKAQNSMGLAVKRQAIEYTMQKVGDKPFSLDSLSTCWKLNGYRYLFAVFGREPVKSYVDPNFAYLYGTTPVWDYHPPTVVAFVIRGYAPETQAFYSRYALLKSHQVSSSQFGAIEVIIMDNTTGWFDK